MNENNYLIQFEYDGKNYSIHNLTHNDLSKGNAATCCFISDMIIDYLDELKLSKPGGLVSKACMFGKDGELVVNIPDFTI